MTDKQIIIKEITECGFYCAKEDVERLYIYEVIKNTDEEWLKETPEQTLLIDEWIYDYTDNDDRKVYTTSGNLTTVCNGSANFKVYKIEDTKYKIYGNCGKFLIEDKPTYKEQLKAKEQECEKLLEFNNSLVEEHKTIGNDLYKEIKEYRKKLQAKEQEYERLKRDYFKQNEWLQEQKKELDQLKAQLLDQEAETLEVGGIIETLKKENEQLKKKVCGLRPELKYIIDKTCCKYNINAKYYHEKIVEIINNLDKLKQTLTEIKEIAEKCRSSLYGYDQERYPKQILQKISEVEDEHNG